tara:strand:+ start:485 stop:601 length:117 start_codon:yes stop_codon:yes gene_type:complete
MAESLKNVAKSGHIVVSGKNGQGLLDYFNGTLDKIAKR